VARFEGQPNQTLKENLFFLLQYELQAVFVLPCASTLYWVFRNYEESENTTPRWTFIVGAVISVFGTIMEWVADDQISEYRAQKALQKKMEKTNMENADEFDK